MPVDIFATVSALRGAFDAGIGIHCHNDSEVAVANSIAAVQAGATQVQGTINGYGERCGNANLLSVIGNLKLKLGIDCVSDDQLAHLTEVSRFVAELANMPRSHYQAYVGDSAFTHKGRLHASATAKMDMAYQHVNPGLVGNARRVVISELAGRANLVIKIEEAGLAADVPKERLTELLSMVKDREAMGFQYEGAEASFQLLVRRALPAYKSRFDLVDYMVVVEKRRRQNSVHVSNDETLCEAMVKVRVGGEVMHTVSEGNGPVNALDSALRKGLAQVYPEVARVQLVDYKVRVVEQGSNGTGAVVRVLAESTDGERHWNTVGASTNLIEASWQALADSLEYALLER
jgi:2-isopropylmalate synthase